jgi:hypothetical protein
MNDDEMLRGVIYKLECFDSYKFNGEEFRIMPKKR